MESSDVVSLRNSGNFFKQEPISSVLNLFVRLMQYFVFEIVVWLTLFDCDAGHLSAVCNSLYSVNGVVVFSNPCFCE